MYLFSTLNYLNNLCHIPDGIMWTSYGVLLWSQTLPKWARMRTRSRRKRGGEGRVWEKTIGGYGFVECLQVVRDWIFSNVSARDTHKWSPNLTKTDPKAR